MEKTDLEVLREAFDKIGVEYTVQTRDENDDIHIAHVVLYTEEFMFLFKKDTQIFVRTRNIGME